ncbi:MAG: ATP synthase F1 subunit gamma [Candidatus Magasanikbacteria bacterium CG_4_9_14_0_2_um_filter_41_10]|uniref:ATP synthase gamma chain n=1 Tax=Candidatus Magasanikbacteria bacterium CG_4_10_14_0_2_um_filter_41_31 TaxID=1974639 RepID=A0A2M7V4D7_9BACT|nr:MAG: ATP synthase F1 subunit gamma [Candidatus Magasanikbacteria bacterium CG1_02_41_34]PIZ93403.1 MAG: ATP synthase F1 subunit gamma [Candidatus Magasanikbacteria bacterium CG_4_10_14_0_2_um_filter_41_31]PJC53204.1 MAG: ATP synthase F1 subunit gamma [Candidatus Magasanikbacteria bacterium CG_4_9_14_0_2_um_filter_41_10]
MAVNAKIIKRRIKSVTNTKKMTKAMEMISAVKMRKAVETVLNTRLYARLGRELMEHLAHLNEPNVPLLEQRPVKKVLAIIISSNRGQCGSFNANLFKKTKTIFADIESLTSFRSEQGIIPSQEKDVEIDVLAVGKKSVSFSKKQGYTVVAVFDELSEKPSYDDIRPIANMAMEGFIGKTYDKVVIAFTEYQSSLSQDAKVRQLLPFSSRELEKMTAEIAKHEIKEDVVEDEYPIEGYLFEPGLDTIVEEVLPRLVEMQLYQGILESSASEHSARMVAMKNASENAGDMITELNLTYNKARQAAITQEIAEIAGGAAALE